MQKREKLLAILLGSVVLLWVGLPIFESAFVEPLLLLSNEEESLQKRQTELFDEQIDLRQKVKQIGAWRKISLPPDPLNAQRLYQEWLTDLAQLSGFEGTKVTLERRADQGGVYTTIPVTLEAKATMQELAQFLERFRSVDLLHRIASCNAISPASEGNPELQVTLTAEGLSLASAPERIRLFPQVDLEQELKEDQRKLTLPTSPVGFPEQAPFRIRVDNEFINVTEVNDREWTLQRGVGKTFAEDHASGTTIEMFPMVDETESRTRDVERLWANSVFTKPAPQANYDPKLASSDAPPAVRGRTWNWKLEVTGWNPAFGSPNYNLLEAPEGMKLDERNGTLSWPVGAGESLGVRNLQVMVWGSASKEAGLTSTVNLRVRDPNEPPSIDVDGALKFFLGRRSEKRIPASDPDGEDDQLTYSIEGAPEGMQLDSRRGILTWTPPQTLDPQTMQIQVTVTDSDEDPESTTRTIPISLEEDSARYTYLTTTFKRVRGAGDVEWEAYLFDRATNTTTMLREGERVVVSDFEMTVREIGDDFVNVLRPEGLYRIVFERPLVAMIELPDDASTAPESSDVEVDSAESQTPSAVEAAGQPVGAETEAPEKADVDETSQPTTNDEASTSDDAVDNVESSDDSEK